MSKQIVDIDEVEDAYGDIAKVQVLNGLVSLIVHIKGEHGDACLLFNEDQVNQLIIALDKAKGM